MPIFSVIPELCKQDGICASVCPTHVIKGPKGTLPVMRPGGENDCIACGHCMAFCPHGAARVDALPLEDMQPIDRKLLPSAEAVEALCKARRSIRRFKVARIPRELLERVLAVTRHCPSAKNQRAVRWIVIHGSETMRAVGNAAAEWFGLPETAAIVPEAKGLQRAWQMGLDPLFRGAPHLVLAVADKTNVWAETDAAIALTYIEIAALPHGIGACWAGYITAAACAYPPLQRLLGVGEEELVRGGQMLGFTSLRPTASAPRERLREVWL